LIYKKVTVLLKKNEKKKKKKETKNRYRIKATEKLIGVEPIASL
jgi:hypothetical protein